MVLILRRRLVAAAVAVAALAGSAVAGAPVASAHPLGNFTVNYYTGILVKPHAVEVALVVDRAEIPTLQAFPDAAPGRLPAGAVAWRASQCAQLARQAVLLIGDSRKGLLVTSSRLALLTGSAGLATSRLECTLRTSGSVDLLDQRVSYQAATTSGRLGWHEVTASGDGTILTGSDVPAQSISQELTLYPQDLLTSPLDDRTARFDVRAGSGLVAAETAARAPTSGPLQGLDRFTSLYTALVSRNTLTPAFALLAILLSVLLGGLHAFAPGHGKTLMAAYLVGREGTWRQAAVIGVSVTATHTMGVLLLGAALSAAVLAAPEQVYPWLGLASGILLAGIGVTLMRSARTNHRHGAGGHTHGPGGHTHPLRTPSHVADLVSTVPVPSPDRHSHSHGHSHEPTPGRAQGHGLPHGQATPPTPRSTGNSWRLAAVGLAGGLVPSPSALLVLLGGIALGRAWFGAVLVLFYGIGMAAALVGAGLLLVLARDRLGLWGIGRPDRPTLPGQVLVLQVTRALPLLTATAVLALGASTAIRSLLTIWVF